MALCQSFAQHLTLKDIINMNTMGYTGEHMPEELVSGMHPPNAYAMHASSMAKEASGLGIIEINTSEHPALRD